MHLKEEGTALISTIIILSLISFLGCSMYKMMKSNMELESVYCDTSGLYYVETKEEDIIYDFMKKLNEEAESKRNEDEDYDINETFENDFETYIDDDFLEYKRDVDELSITTMQDENLFRKRILNYKIKDKKIILIPTYKFKNIES